MLSLIYTLITYLSSLAISSCGEGVTMATIPSDSRVSIMMVRNAIGCPSTDLGTLCAKARVGGKGGYAFDIVENGSTAKNGYLIDEALPYWNIHSNESPGYWTYGHKTDLPPIQPLVMRLKIDSSYNYMFSLGSFRGYDHEAQPPTVPDMLVQGLSGTEYDVMVRCRMGDYDWKKVDSTMDGVALFEMNGNNLGQQLSEAYDFSRNSPLNIPIHVSISTATVGTKDMVLALGQMSSHDFNAMCILPVKGSLTTALQTYTMCRFTLVIQADGNTSTFRSGSSRADNTTGSWSNTIRNTAAMRQLPLASLKKVTYVGTNADGESITVERTQINISRDSPLNTSDFHEFPVGSSIGLSAAVDTTIRNHVGAVGGSIIITMLYT